MSANLVLALAEPELRATSRVLEALLASDHPMVKRAIDAALGDANRQDLVQASRHLHAALLLAESPDEFTATHPARHPTGPVLAMGRERRRA